jgi:hypothetical protein
VITNVWPASLPPATFFSATFFLATFFTTVQPVPSGYQTIKLRCGQLRILCLDFFTDVKKGANAARARQSQSSF